MTKKQKAEHKKNLQRYIKELDNAWWRNRTRKFRRHKNSGKDYIRPNPLLKEAIEKLRKMDLKVEHPQVLVFESLPTIKFDHSIRMMGSINWTEVTPRKRDILAFKAVPKRLINLRR